MIFAFLYAFASSVSGLNFLYEFKRSAVSLAILEFLSNVDDKQRY